MIPAAVKTFARFILGVFGWKVIGQFPEGIRKCVVIEAPHTSMWDFVLGWLAFKSLGIPVKFLIKKELFFWPVGPPLKRLGGIPVDRQRNNNMVQYISGLFDSHESLCIAITPEGTRKKVEHWKKGFYYIALHAKVPIVLGYLNYSRKEGGAGPVIWPCGDFNKDMMAIEAFYRDKTAKHPERFNLTQ